MRRASVIAHASGQALDFAAIASQTAIINITNNAGGTIGASGDDAIRPGAGHINIVNSGMIDSTASGSRAINLNASNLSMSSRFELDNHQGGTIQSQGDTVRITATTLSGNPTGSFTIDNSGTIKSTGTGANNGQAIDFNDLVSANGHVTITNEATGLIQAADADAIGPGSNATVNNYGTIKSLNGTPTSTGNDGIDFQKNTGDSSTISPPPIPRRDLRRRATASPATTRSRSPIPARSSARRLRDQPRYRFDHHDHDRTTTAPSSAFGRWPPATGSMSTG